MARLGAAGPWDVVLTDPPYCSGGFQESGRGRGSVGRRGNWRIANDTLSTRGYQALMRQALGLWPAGIAYVFTDWRMWVNLFDVVESCGYGVRNMVVWDKGSPALGVGWRAQHELVMCGVRVTHPFARERGSGNVLQEKRSGNKLHATEKPVRLCARLLEVCRDAVEVCDPFAGSGTTLMAAEITGRTAHVAELEPHLCDVILHRWEKHTGESAVRLEG